MDYVSYIRSKVGHDKIIINAAGGIIVNDEGKILLQRRSDNGKWGLIGGIMEMDETYHSCALREIKEETGLEVNLDYLIGVYHSYNMVWPSKDEAHVICAVFKASIKKGEVRLDEESLELKFFSKDEIPEIHAEDHIAAIKDYFLGVKNNVL